MSNKYNKIRPGDGYAVMELVDEETEENLTDNPRITYYGDIRNYTSKPRWWRINIQITLMDPETRVCEPIHLKIIPKAKQMLSTMTPDINAELLAVERGRKAIKCRCVFRLDKRN